MSPGLFFFFLPQMSAEAYSTGTIDFYKGSVIYRYLPNELFCRCSQTRGKKLLRQEWLNRFLPVLQCDPVPCASFSKHRWVCSSWVVTVQCWIPQLKEAFLYVDSRTNFPCWVVGKAKDYATMRLTSFLNTATCFKIVPTLGHMCSSWFIICKPSRLVSSLLIF